MNRHPVAGPSFVIRRLLQGRDPVLLEALHGVAVKPFALTDALGTRDAAAALATLRDQLLAGKDALEVMGLIAWQLNRWMAIKRLARATYTVEQITLYNLTLFIIKQNLSQCTSISY